MYMLCQSFCKNVTRLYTYNFVYTYIHILFYIFSIIFYNRIFNIVSCGVYSRTLLFIHSKCTCSIILDLMLIISVSN